MNKQLDLTLYLVLDPSLCGGIEGMIKTTRIAIQHGVTIVQLRAEKAFSRREWYEAAKQLKQILINTTVPLIINDMVDIALATDADGVHIGQNDLPAHEVRRLIGQKKLLGLSISNQEQMISVPWPIIDYIGIGPVFPTTSKYNAPPSLGINTLSSLAKQKNKPAVAIGGINYLNITEVLNVDIDGIAVISAICGQADIDLSTQQLYSLITMAQNKEK